METIERQYRKAAQAEASPAALAWRLAMLIAGIAALAVMLLTAGCTNPFAAKYYTSVDMPVGNGQVAKFVRQSEDSRDDVTFSAEATLDPKTGIKSIKVSGSRQSDVNTQAHADSMTAQYKTIDRLSTLAENLGAMAVKFAPVPVGGVPAGGGTAVIPQPAPVPVTTDAVSAAVAGAAVWAAAQPAAGALGNTGPWTAPVPAGATVPNPSAGASLPTDVLRPWSTAMWIEVQTVADGLVPGLSATAQDVSDLKAGVMTLGRFSAIVGPGTTMGNAAFQARNRAYAARFGVAP